MDLKNTPEAYVLYGSITEANYRRYAPELPNNPEHTINLINEKFAERKDRSNDPQRSLRINMFQTYDQLSEHLESDKNCPTVEFVYEYLRRASSKAADELKNYDKGLGQHLKEIKDFAINFLLTDDGKSSFPNLLTDRHALLLAYVAAPLHDALKFISDRQASVIPDHEVQAAEIIRNYCIGRKVSFGQSESTLEPEDVKFLASVVGDHENLCKELGRSNWIQSDNITLRAKALFSFIDTLTGTIIRNSRNEWIVDSTQLDNRFVDLYFRHIDLEKGKIFRPEWGINSVQDLQHTLKEIQKSRSILGAPGDLSINVTLTRAALTAIDRALKADAKRREEGSGTLLNVDQLKRVADARKVFMDSLAK